MRKRRSAGWRASSGSFSARSSARNPRSCRPTSSTCRWKMSSWRKVCWKPPRKGHGLCSRAPQRARAGRTIAIAAIWRGVERIIEPASSQCPCGCGEMVKIGEDVSERLDVIPAQFRVLVTRRPKYACRRCSEAVVQAHAPEHVVPGGLPTELFIAWIIVSKFGDHLPFYRQAEIYRRQGIDLDW